MNDVLDIAGADDGVHFGNLLADLVAEALHQASGDDQPLRAAELLVLGHLQDRVHRFLLRGLDEAAGVDDEHVGVAGARRQLVAVRARMPIMTSLSTRFLGHPRLRNPTFGKAGKRSAPLRNSDSSTRGGLAAVGGAGAEGGLDFGQERGELAGVGGLAAKTRSLVHFS